MIAYVQGKRLWPRKSPSRELEELGLDLIDAASVLEEGFECSSGGRRKEGIIERCLQRGDKVIRVVAAEGLLDNLDGEKELVYYLVHVSIESINRKRNREK